MRETITTSMTLAILATDLCAAQAPPPPPMSITPSGHRDVSVNQTLTPRPGACVDDDAMAERLTRDLAARLSRLEEDEKMLGKRRRRELRIARHNMTRDADAVFNLRDDDPVAFEQTADILRSCLVKLTRERLERRYHLDTLDERLASRWERRRGRGEARVGETSGDDHGGKEHALRISPRFDLGRDPYLGANFRLRRGEGDVWSRFTLGLRQRFESDTESVFLQYEDDNRFVRFEQVFGDELAGDQVLLSLRMRY